MQKGFSAIIILVAVLIILAVVGGAYYLGRQTTPKSQSQSPVVTSQLSSSPSPTSNETVNWKTYTNKKYHLAFNYPPNGEADEGSAQSSIRIFNNNAPPYFIFTIDIQDNPSHLTNQQAVDKIVESVRNNKYNPVAKDQADKTIQTLKEYTNGQIKAIRLKSFFEGYEEDYGEIIYATENNIYTFNIHDGSGGVGNLEEKLLDQILSTFKFTDQDANSRKVCQTDNNCPTGDHCVVWGPLRADGQNQKYCTAPNEAVPL